MMKNMDVRLLSDEEEDEGTQANWDIVPIEEIAAYSEREVRRQGVARHVAPLVVGSILLLPLAWLFPPAMRSSMFLVLLAGSCVLGCIAVLRYQKVNPPISDRDRVLYDDFGVGARSLVEMTISQKGVVCGVDRGIVWLEDQKLCYVGHHTSFALGGYYTSRMQAFETPPMIGERQAGYALWLKGKSGLELEVRLTCLTEGQVPSALYQLMAIMDRWKQEKNHQVKGQFPPTDLGPGASSVASVARSVAASSLLLWASAAGLGWIGWVVFKDVVQLWIRIPSVIGLFVVLIYLISQQRFLIDQLKFRRGLESTRGGHGHG